MDKFLHILIIILLTSCSSVSVVSQRDRQVFLDDYISFNWMSNAYNEGSDQFRVMRIIQSQALREMVLRGYAYTPESPEILVNLEAITESNPAPQNAQKSGFSYWQGYNSMQSHNPGDVVVEFVDIEREKVIWQGAIQNGLSAPQKEEKIGLIVKELFSQLNY